MIETIRDRLIAILQTLDEVQNVYAYATQQTTGFPYAYVLYKGDESEELTNTQDRVTYEFEITLIQEKLEDFKGPEEAETISITRAYEIAESLRADNALSLSGVIRVRPLRTAKSYVEGGTRIQLQITVLVETREDVTA